MNRQEKAAKIDRLCSAHGCSEKLRKIHFEQFVDREWHPHPPPSWERWIRTQPDFQEMTMVHGTTEREASVKLFNCQSYYSKFCEAKDMGII